MLAPQVAIRANKGFTLLEIGVVLVIVGLVAGGILVARDLIRSSYMHSQITQIEKYKSAVGTFEEKFGALPGDMNNTIATQFNFAPRGTQPGQGDGNGVISGFSAAPLTWGAIQSGEPTAFWVDISQVGLIESNFNTALPTGLNTGLCTITNSTTPNLGNYFPSAKLGQGNYVVVWSGGYVNCGGACGGPGCNTNSDGINYFAVVAMPSLSCWANVMYVGWTGGSISAQGAISVSQAYQIDKKVDDGLPQSGAVMAMGPIFMNGIWSGTTNMCVPPYTTATLGNASTCFDNNNVAGAAQQYSVTQNGGSGINCSLSFKF